MHDIIKKTGIDPECRIKPGIEAAESGSKTKSKEIQ